MTSLSQSLRLAMSAIHTLMANPDHPENYRAYGLLLRDGRALIAAEYVGDVFCWKFPGGGVEAHETDRAALVREFQEETGLHITVGSLLSAPGTLLSPWSGVNYTPVYYAVSGEGEIVTPPHEPVEMSFKHPREAIMSGLMAAPEMAVLEALLKLSS